MADKDKTYSIRFDGCELQRIVLEYSQYRTQVERHKVRAMMADHYGLKEWQIRLVDVGIVRPPHIYTTDMKTGKSTRKEI